MPNLEKSSRTSQNLQEPDYYPSICPIGPLKCLALLFYGVFLKEFIFGWPEQNIQRVFHTLVHVCFNENFWFRLSSLICQRPGNRLMFLFVHCLILVYLVYIKLLWPVSLFVRDKLEKTTLVSQFYVIIFVLFHFCYFFIWKFYQLKITERYVLEQSLVPLTNNLEIPCMYQWVGKCVYLKWKPM